MSEIDKPIFIIGPGRSGTTLIYNLLALHPDLAWFSGWTNRMPNQPWLSILSKIQEFNIIERATRNHRYWPRPAEAYGIWDHCFEAFSQAQKDWDACHVDDEGAGKLVQLIQLHLKWQRKARFLTKYTGWPRIKFIRTLFPSALFLYIDRDPRAVVFSYMKQKWWYKNRIEAFETLTPSARLAFYTNKYLAYYEAKKFFRENVDYMQVYYENLVDDPANSFEAICKYLTLDFKAGFMQRVKTWRVKKATNEIWQLKLSGEESKMLTELLAIPLQEMSYI